MEFDLSEGVAVLERMPRTLNGLLAGLSDRWAQSDEGRETWSPYVVVGHLVHGERADWIPRARVILEHGEAQAFEPFDRLAQFRESEGKTLPELLAEFETLRAENLNTLRGFRLTVSDMQKKGRHPSFGPVTLGQLLATWVVHDLSHIAQISRVMAKQYSSEVGPWSAYLPILSRRGGAS